MIIYANTIIVYASRVPPTLFAFMAQRLWHRFWVYESVLLVSPRGCGQSLANAQAPSKWIGGSYRNIFPAVLLASS